MSLIGPIIGRALETVRMEGVTFRFRARRNLSMQTITMELPEDVFSALRRSPQEFAREMRLAAAIHWYSRGEISQERAAEIAGLDRTDFIMSLAQRRVDVFPLDMESLDEELKRG